MDENLQNMIAMAEKDFQIYELKKRIGGVPKRLSEARRQLDAESRVLEQTETPWNALDEEIRQKESTIAVALETIDKFEAHMKLVKTQKEYMAAKKQVEEARKLNDMLQEDILQARMKQEELHPTLTELRGRYGRVKETYDVAEREILGEKAAMEASIAELERVMKSHAEKVSGAIMTYYKRLSNGGRMPAIVRVERGTCTGCNMALPPQNYNQLIAKPGTFHTCSHCQRIIYYVPPEFAGDAPADVPQESKSASA
ncbi:MAG: hypothetical protein HY342_10260 [Candidatus Lambdaproteobacteria bacterium]|nr:hypothetical protein [Candidatus Lambdaproteobacteria bacterium]